MMFGVVWILWSYGGAPMPSADMPDLFKSVWVENHCQTVRLTPIHDRAWYKDNGHGGYVMFSPSPIGFSNLWVCDNNQLVEWTPPPTPIYKSPVLTELQTRYNYNGSSEEDRRWHKEMMKRIPCETQHTPRSR